ncbi:MAG: peptidyl-alpha-hydroxyglycine alpha-amidating lyase family protein, partial [Longimicrobiales bacterium]|nr:peptidyl-alpha-hydroxyglycine alpha-amidating lyase family protein [Longimicrobiales bacterium]
GGDYAVVTGWPRYPDGMTIGRASGVAVNGDDEVILFHRATARDRNAEGLLDAPTLLVFDAASGELLRTMGEGRFANPHGLDVDDEGNLWIADNRLHQVMKLSPGGEVLMTIGEAGVSGATESLLNGVTDVAIAPDGSIWVSDGYGNNRVVKYDASGAFLFEIGGAEPGTGPGEFELPHGITVDDDGRVYVADRTNARVQVFSPEGEFLAEWTHWAGNDPGDPGRPWGLEYRDGSIWVADGGEYWLTRQFRSERPDTLPFDMAQLQRFDTNGVLQEAWGYYGPQDGRMIWPHDISVDSEGGVYSVEVHEGQRLQKWAPGGGSVR